MRTEAPGASAQPVTTVLLALALIVAVAAPAIGMWSMFLLFLTAPVERGLNARRARPASG